MSKQSIDFGDSVLLNPHSSNTNSRAAKRVRDNAVKLKNTASNNVSFAQDRHRRHVSATNKDLVDGNSRKKSKENYIMKLIH